MFSISFWFNLNILCTNQSGAMHRPTHYLFKMNTIFYFRFHSDWRCYAMWCEMWCVLSQTGNKSRRLRCCCVAVDEMKWNEMIESWFHTFTNHIFYYNAAQSVHASHHQTKRKFVSFSLQMLLCHSSLSWIITCLADVTKSFLLHVFQSERFSFNAALLHSFLSNRI